MSNDDKGVQEVHEICEKIGGPISELECLFLYNLAKECQKGVIVEIGSAEGKSTVCIAKGSKAGHNAKVYSIDPHISGMYTDDISWKKQGMNDSEGTPDEKYYTGQRTGHLKFFDNLKTFGVEDIVTPIVDYSEPAYKNGLGTVTVWDIPIGMLWIDGDHRYRYVKLDVDLWGKHVVTGGKIIMHDRPYPGVSKVINEMIIGNLKYTGITEYPIFNATVV